MSKKLLVFSLMIFFPCCAKIVDPKISLGDLLIKTQANMKNVGAFTFREKSTSAWPGEYKKKMIEDVRGEVDLEKFIKHEVNECLFEDFLQKGQRLKVTYENYTTLDRQYSKKEDKWDVKKAGFDRRHFLSLVNADFLSKADVFKEVIKDDKTDHYYLRVKPSVGEVWNYFIFGGVFKKDESGGIHEIDSIDAVAWVSPGFFLQRIKITLNFRNNKGQKGRFSTEYIFNDFNDNMKIVLPQAAR